VHGLQCGGDAGDLLDDSAHRLWVAAQFRPSDEHVELLSQAGPLDEFHRVVEVLALRSESVHLGEVGMVERGSRHGLALEALPSALGQLAQRLHLERDEPSTERMLSGAVDDAHAAATDRSLDLEVTQARAACEDPRRRGIDQARAQRRVACSDGAQSSDRRFVAGMKPTECFWIRRPPCLELEQNRKQDFVGDCVLGRG